jgi:DNA polymerase III epsilon subunit-like protein
MDEDQLDTLYEVREVIGAGTDWITFDTETTGLQGQIIAWAVCSSSGEVLGSGYVKPTVPIEPGARAIHGITDEQLQDAPSFAEVLPELWRLLEQKTIIIYNAEFDLSRFETSLQALYPFPEAYEAYCEQSRRLWRLRDQAHCAMKWFAVIYGQKHRYYGTYTWQKLATACSYFGIPLEDAHNAICDAQATALLTHKLAELAEQKLPPDYRPLYCTDDDTDK